MLKDSAEGSLTSASKKTIANTKEPRGSGDERAKINGGGGRKALVQNCRTRGAT